MSLKSGAQSYKQSGGLLPCLLRNPISELLSPPVDGGSLDLIDVILNVLLCNVQKISFICEIQYDIAVPSFYRLSSIIATSDGSHKGWINKLTLRRLKHP